MAKDKKDQYQTTVKFTFTDKSEVTYIFKNVQNLLDTNMGPEFFEGMVNILNDISKNHGKDKGDIEAINDQLLFHPFDATDDGTLNEWLVQTFNQNIPNENYQPSLFYQPDALPGSQDVRECISYEEVNVAGQIESELDI